jgi:hypothetical protein
MSSFQAIDGGGGREDHPGQTSRHLLTRANLFDEMKAIMAGEHERIAGCSSIGPTVRPSTPVSGTSLKARRAYR